MQDAVEQSWSRQQELLRENLEWATNLKKRERRDLQERARELDAQPAPRVDGGRLRIVTLASRSGTPDSPQVYYDQAYHLAKAGHLVWLVSYLPAPDWLPSEFRQSVQWVSVPADRPIHLAMPPADVVIATSWEQIPGLYRAGCPFVYLEQGHELLFEVQPNLWHQNMYDPIYYLLPSQVLTVSEQLRGQIRTQAGRDSQVMPAAADSARLSDVEQILRSAAAVMKRDPVRKGRPRVSLCMIVKNEAARIQRCLASTWGVVDEICVVDTGSTDETIKLAERAGARVEIHPWEDHFANSRNYSLAMASGDWVLQLDGDEELTPALRDALPEFVGRDGVHGFLIPIDSKTPTGVGRNYGLRLFRRLPGVKYFGRVHETASSSLERYKPTIQVVQPSIIHHGYTQDAMSAVGKRTRNRELLLKALEEEPSSSWYRYYLAVEEYLVGAPEKALEQLGQLPEFGWIQGEPAALEIECYQVMGSLKKALEAAIRGTEKYPRVLNLWLQQGLLGYALGEINHCKAAVRLLMDPPRVTVGHQDACRATAIYLEGCLAGTAEEAEDHWRRALQGQGLALRPLLRSIARRQGLTQAVRAIKGLPVAPRGALHVLLQGLIDLGNWNEAVGLLERLPSDKPLAGMGSVFWALGKTEEALNAWRQAGGAGWIYYGIVAALFGERSDLDPLKEKVTPMHALALADLQAGEPTWRLATLVGPVIDQGSSDLADAVRARAPFLDEAMSGYRRLHILP